MATTVKFTPVLSGLGNVELRKPDVWDDSSPGFIQMTWALPTRHMLDAVRTVAAREVLQVRNRDGFMRVVVSPGTALLELATDETFRRGGGRAISAFGVLQVATATVNQGIDQLVLLFWFADDMFVSGTGEVTSVPVMLPPPEPEPVPE